MGADWGVTTAGRSRRVAERTPHQKQEARGRIRSSAETLGPRSGDQLARDPAQSKQREGLASRFRLISGPFRYRFWVCPVSLPD